MAPMISSWSMYCHCQWNYPLEFQVFCVVDVWVMWRPLPTVVLGVGGGDDDAGHLSLKKLVWWQCQYHLEILQMITYNYLFVFCVFSLLTSLALLITFTKTFGTQTIKLVITIIATSLSAFQILLRHTQLHLVWHVVVLSLSLLGEYFFPIAFQFVDRYFWLIF